MILDKKIQGIVITSYCRVEERKIIVACIYFAWRCDVVKKKRYRLPCILLSDRRLSDSLSFLLKKKRQAGKWDMKKKERGMSPTLNVYTTE